MKSSFSTISAPGYEILAAGFELVKGDMLDSAALARVLPRADAIMHFAAHAYVGESVTNPRKYFHNNVEGGLSLLNAALDAGVKKIIFSSTCAVYGEPAKVPIEENMPRQPVNPYGVTKLFFEQALEAYDRAYGFAFASLRYFNAAGADESGEIGELHDPETHLIPLALRAAAGLGPELAGIWFGLSDAGWNLRARLHPRKRSGKRALEGAGPSGRGEGKLCRQRRNGHGSVGAGSDLRRRGSDGKAGSAQDGAAAPRRSSEPGGESGKGAGAAAMEGDARAARRRGDRMELDGAADQGHGKVVFHHRGHGGHRGISFGFSISSVYSVSSVVKILLIEENHGK